MFKISGGGRLQFIIYREQPTTPANEIKEIPIDEFGGVESGVRMDNEKLVFCVITGSVTDCFSTETVEELNEWTSLLQEYLGKGWFTLHGFIQDFLGQGGNYILCISQHFGFVVELYLAVVF